MQGTLPLKSLSETSNIKQEGQLVHLKKKKPKIVGGTKIVLLKYK